MKHKDKVQDLCEPEETQEGMKEYIYYEINRTENRGTYTLFDYKMAVCNN